MNDMHAVRIHHRAGPAQLVFEVAPRPIPHADDVLVDVHAAGITPTGGAVGSAVGSRGLGVRPVTAEGRLPVASTARAGSTVGAHRTETTAARRCSSPVRRPSGEPLGCLIRTARLQCLPAKPLRLRPRRRHPANRYLRPACSLQAVAAGSPLTPVVQGPVEDHAVVWELV